MGNGISVGITVGARSSGSPSRNHKPSSAVSSGSKGDFSGGAALSGSGVMKPALHHSPQRAILGIYGRYIGDLENYIITRDKYALTRLLHQIPILPIFLAKWF